MSLLKQKKSALKILGTTEKVKGILGGESGGLPLHRNLSEQFSNIIIIQVFNAQNRYKLMNSSSLLQNSFD